MEHAPVYPPPFIDANIRTYLLQTTQAMTAKTQKGMTQVQAITTQENRHVVPCTHQEVTTMASRLRDFTQKNPPTFHRSMDVEDPQEIHQ